MLMLLFKDLFSVTSEDYGFAQNLFEMAFPIDERPLFHTLASRDKSKFSFQVVYDEAMPIGLLSHWVFEGGVVYIEHFAVAEQLRNAGYGKKILEAFMSTGLEQVVLEVEKPSTEMARRRKNFYKRLGFVDNPQQYFQPSYHGNDEMLPMDILSLKPLSDEYFCEVKSMLYEYVYHKL